jgi:hypothetical protein
MNDILKQLHDAVIDCIEVPAEWVPESYRGKRKMISLRSVVRQARKRGVIESKHQELKRIKAERIAQYAAQYAKNESFDYIVDEKLLYDAQVRFCNVAAAAGQMDFDD